MKHRVAFACAHQQRGQAYAELMVSFAVVGLFLLGAGHIWRYIEARQALYSAVRFAAWERTVWEPEDNTVEKHAIHASDSTVARQVRIHQLSTPDAWVSARENIPANGSVWVASPKNATATLFPAMRSFANNPDAMLTVKTTSEQQQGVFVGADPTYKTTTSLELDRNVFRRVRVSLKSQISQSTNWASRVFGFPLPDINDSRTMVLVANPWAASPPVNRVRSFNQLLVMSAGDPTSGTKANLLAYFGADNAGNNLGLGDFVGMVPWWQFIGGVNGLGGNYVVKKIGLDTPGASAMLNAGFGQYGWDSTKPLAANVLLRPQLAQNESFSPNNVSNAFNRQLLIKDKTADASTPTPRNSVVKGKRKYIAMPISPNDYFGQ